MSQPESAPVAAPDLVAERYEVEQRVGQGGTALVYRCRDTHTQGIVALKLLRSGNPLAPASRARFDREARLAASLSHPNTIRVLDYGETTPPNSADWTTWIFDSEEPVKFICMEYVAGPTLKQLVRRMGPCPTPWVLAVAQQLAGALMSAHASGIIHRDVKPQNILLLDTTTHVVAKLGDFGIARDLNGNTQSTLTKTGQVLGTPDYLAPEQVMGEAGGPQSDLYALGIVLYELFTGHLPFEAETPLAAASRRMFVDAPSLRVFVPQIAPALDQVLMMALARETGQRFHTVRDLADALDWAAREAGISPDDAWPFGPDALPLTRGLVPTPIGQNS
jgi:eukaryotic-like serine/threonine-protein kinase